MSNKVTYYWYEYKNGTSNKYYIIFHTKDGVCKINYDRINYRTEDPSRGEAQIQCQYYSSYSHKNLKTLRAERENKGYNLVQIGFI